ncbi:MAG: hypothetical protein J0H59_07660 [Comamonadaceae bacterium]|nr:hypothetical protein [Comamonadaceae bacterium]
MKITQTALISSLLFAFTGATQAQNAFINESPTYIRFEQYTGSSGDIVFWRLPYPGSSVFPGTSCTAVTIPSAKPEHASRFMALYLFAKNSNKNVFYQINPSCNIISFGMDG